MLVSSLQEQPTFFLVPVSLQIGREVIQLNLTNSVNISHNLCNCVVLIFSILGVYPTRGCKCNEVLYYLEYLPSGGGHVNVLVVGNFCVEVNCLVGVSVVRDFCVEVNGLVGVSVVGDFCVEVQGLTVVILGPALHRLP